MKKTKKASTAQAPLATTLLIQSKYALDALVRPDIHMVAARFVCVRKGCAHATDGRTLATVPCEGTGTRDILIPPGIFAQARQSATRRRDDTTIVCKDGMLAIQTKGGTITVEESIVSEPFPNVAVAAREPSGDEVHVGIDAALLEKLQHALGAAAGVVLHFRIDKNRNAEREVIRVTVPRDKGVVGAIMPCVED